MKSLLQLTFSNSIIDEKIDFKWKTFSSLEFWDKNWTKYYLSHNLSLFWQKKSPWGTQFWLWYHFKLVHKWNKPFNCRKCALTLSHMGYFPTHSTWQGVVITPSKDILTLISEFLFLWSLCGQVVTALGYSWTGFLGPGSNPGEIVVFSLHNI